MKHEKICVLASGGVESAVLLDLYSRKEARVFPLYVQHGFVWERAELHWLRKLIARLRRPSIQPVTILQFPIRPLYGKHWSVAGKGVPSRRSPDRAVFLPGRNLLLAVLAGLFCYRKGIRRVAVGTLASNPFPDSTARFFRLMEKSVKEALGWKLRVERPFAGRSKREVMARASSLPWHLTFSCLNPRGLRHCGRCNKCAERSKAFRKPG